ncbi:hypothetical protein NDU88_005685 [Pleurodeles waltl]|uniref:Uncharacterized protein n=1 Tax=Pleurodeles waltl TaxID=8319 RepID=A0AAV7X1E4_PLEWA|nr:hypothetical protein NDU88_005685 [Pleurodeles waltl]
MGRTHPLFPKEIKFLCFLLEGINVVPRCGDCLGASRLLWVRVQGSGRPKQRRERGGPGLRTTPRRRAARRSGLGCGPRGGHCQAGSPAAAEVAARGAFPPQRAWRSRGCLRPRGGWVGPGPRDSAAGTPEDGRGPRARSTGCPWTGLKRASPEAVPPDEGEKAVVAPLGPEPLGSHKDLAAQRHGPDRARTGRRGVCSAGGAARPAPQI